MKLSSQRQRSDPIEWSGGQALVTIGGRLANDGNVSTSVEIVGEVRQRDGSHTRARPIRTLSEAGVFDVGLQPGRYWLNAAGPHDLPWRIDVSIEKRGRS